MNFNPRTHMGCEGADGKGYGYQTPYGRGYKAKDFTASQINQMAWGEKAFSRWKELGLDVGSRFALKFVSLQDNKQSHGLHLEGECVVICFKIHIFAR